jgi:hypothetical protein
MSEGVKEEKGVRNLESESRYARIRTRTLKQREEISFPLNTLLTTTANHSPNYLSYFYYEGTLICEEEQVDPIFPPSHL